MSVEAGTSHLGKSPRYLRLLSLLLLVASPVLVMLLLSLMSWQNMFLSKPIFNDEMSYWRLMYSISERGFDFGSTEHLVGYVAPYGPLGSHGLSPVAAWLWYVLLFPMTDSALVIAGVIMLSAALLLMYIIARPGISETLLIALFTLLYPPLVRYINLSMMEMPCYACVIVYMALLLRYEKEQSGALPRSFWTLPLLFVCGLYCTLLRMSNVVLFFPAILIFCHNRLSLKLLLCLVLYALGTLAFNYCFSLFVAPYPDVLYNLMQSGSLGELLQGLWLNTRTNIINYLDPFSDNSLPQAMARYFYLLVLLALLGKTLLKREGGRLRLTWRWAYLGVFAAGAAGLLIVLTIYYVFDWRDYRTLAPLAYCMVLWLLLRWSGEGRGFRLGLAALMLFGLLMAPESYGHVAQDPRFYPDESTGLDYSELFGDEACTLGLYGTAYDLALMKDVPANVGICGGIYEENTHGYGMDYILSLPGDPAPSPEYYEYYAPMEGYGDLYRRLTD